MKRGVGVTKKKEMYWGEVESWRRIKVRYKEKERGWGEVRKKYGFV